jgi:hypothetical protein
VTDNEVISKRRGECRHESSEWVDNDINAGAEYYCGDCGEYYYYQVEGKKLVYDSEPSAWDDKLYREIEEKGLVNSFIAYLMSILFTNVNDVPKTDGGVMFALMSATPAQKASALAQAINQGGEG